MADFKIKSGAGSGNKTLLQGQDQVDSAYAIEIGDAGATTLTNATLTAGSLASGVTGGSGLTELGTVTSGTLGTGVNHPTGSVIKVHQQVTAVVSTLSWTSGTNQIQSYTFTPDTRTTNLMITSYCQFQLYGNGTTNSPDMNFNFLHNGTEYESIDGYHHNYGANLLHSIHTVIHTEIVGVNSHSASGSRAVVMQVEPNAGRFYISSPYDHPSITIMELA
tara:strand:- start:997 stop:1656 length:660 start_codon:yes stop_codon:yes gene_type:complete